MSAAKTTREVGDPTRGYRLEARREEDGSWTLLVPDLPGCVATGDNMAEALEDLPDVIDLWIATAESRGIPVPAPAEEEEYSGKFVLRIAKSLHARASREAAREGISLNAYCANALAEVVYGRVGAAIAVRATRGLVFSKSVAFRGSHGSVFGEWKFGSWPVTLPGSENFVARTERAPSDEYRRTLQ